MGNIYNGVQRSLVTMKADIGDFLFRGVRTHALDRDRKWRFTPAVKAGAKVEGGDIIGTVQETGLIEHRIMVPPYMSGVIDSIAEGDYTVEETVAVLKSDGKDRPLTLMQRWLSLIHISEPTRPY